MWNSSRAGTSQLNRRGGDATALRRLVPVTVIPDRAPTIRVEAPGKDLLLPDARPVIALAAGATDDFGLQSLELRYTKVSGSGEQFEFKEGTLPLAIARPSPREWKATAELALSRIGLEPGDAMIYRVVGRDERPGDAGVASSETFFIEVAGPGQVALAGFELPPDRERYALSQQMIVLKLERLRAREKGLDRSVLEQEVGNLAAEQRAVRANFVFLMGGQIEDEEAEAEHSHEIQEGRLENTARREIIAAIQEMGKVEAGLAAINTGAALPPARAAVEALQRAFGRNRYILRTLPVRSRVDPSRRLTGELSAASDWRRELYPPAADPAVDAAEDDSTEAAGARAGHQGGHGYAPPQLTALAEEALAIDPTAEDWQVASRGLLQLRDRRGSDKERAETLNQAVARIAGVVDRAAMAPRPQSKDNSLRSAWAAERPLVSLLTALRAGAIGMAIIGLIDPSWTTGAARTGCRRHQGGPEGSPGGGRGAQAPDQRTGKRRVDRFERRSLGRHHDWRRRAHAYGSRWRPSVDSRPQRDACSRYPHRRCTRSEPCSCRMGSDVHRDR